MLAICDVSTLSCYLTLQLHQGDSSRKVGHTKKASNFTVGASMIWSGS